MSLAQKCPWSIICEQTGAGLDAARAAVSEVAPFPIAKGHRCGECDVERCGDNGDRSHQAPESRPFHPLSAYPGRKMLKLIRWNGRVRMRQDPTLDFRQFSDLQ